MKNHSKTWRNFNPVPYVPGTATKALVVLAFVWFIAGLIKAF